MKTLDRYLAWSVFKGTVLMLLILVPLFGLITLVRELDDIGRGRYRFTDALIYVAFKAPGVALGIIPTCGLLGTVYALGSLAGARELVAMRTIGMSLARIIRAALFGSLPFAVATLVLAEVVAPPLGQQAESARALAISATPAVRALERFWFLEGNSFVRVGEIRQGRFPADIHIFEMDPAGFLRSITEAATAEIEDDGIWLLRDVRRRMLHGDADDVQNLETLAWETTMTAVELGVVLQRPASLSPSALLEQARVSRERGQPAQEYELLFWQKLALPIACLVMALLGMPFAFGGLRDATLGRRLMAGALVGVLAYLLNQVIGYVGLLVGLNPAATAFLPVVLTGGLAIYLVAHVR
jgi:lipopolysaccharide export system permease protein